MLCGYIILRMSQLISRCERRVPKAGFPVGCKAHKFEAAHISAIHSQTRRNLSLGQTSGDAPDNPLSEQEWVEKHTSGSGCVP
jgi:hypothetical protein